MVKEAVQQLAVPKMTSSSAAPAHLVEFDISPSGIHLTDPQKKFFGRKHFSSKTITYVLRIRCVYKEYCNVVMNNDYDLSVSFVETILHLLLRKVGNSTAMSSWRLRCVFFLMTTLYHVHCGSFFFRLIQELL